jgi:ribonuclease Z
MDFSVTILGNSAALPTRNRNTTAQVVTHHDRVYMLDCGEGAQNRMRDFGIKFSKCSHIFISHLHGDHYYGLPGLITSLHLNKRIQPLTIFSPKGLKEIIELNLQASDTNLSYVLNFVIVDEKSTILYEDDLIKVEPIIMQHRIPCFGYLFTEKRERVNIKTEALHEYKIPVDIIAEIKAGSDFKTSYGKVIPNNKLVLRRAPRKYAFCSDTIYTESYIYKLKEVDLLYHESTFLEADIEKAKDRFHCTAKQAASIARKAAVKQLLLGHFSSRYASEKFFENEAQEIFTSSTASVEGHTYAIN